MSAHTTGLVDAGIELSFRIGQRVRHRDFKGRRVTGVVRGLSIDSDSTLMADILLDAAIVIPPGSADDRAISLWRQHVPVIELAPFDEREELVAVFRERLTDAVSTMNECAGLLISMGHTKAGEAIKAVSDQCAEAMATGAAA